MFLSYLAPCTAEVVGDVLKSNNDAFSESAAVCSAAAGSSMSNVVALHRSMVHMTLILEIEIRFSKW